MANDHTDLKRFRDAQASCYAQVVGELRRGRKTSHWMWFVFPQIAGLGHSATAQLYAIASLDEARAYLADPVLGARLVECTGIINSLEDRTLREIFGMPDALKFRSSMTLFARAASEPQVFRAALEKYCNSREDPLTLERLGLGEDG